MKYWMMKDIEVIVKKMGMVLANGYEQTLMQKLVESDVSISIRTIIPIRYNGPFVMMLAVLWIISCIILALNPV